MDLYLTNALVVDCATDAPDPVPASVLVLGGTIAAVDVGGARPPAGAAVVDLEGGYLLPGLWDVHCHPGGMIPDPQRVSHFESEAQRTLRAVRNTQAALRAGVTSLRPVGEANFIDVALREAYAGRAPAGLWATGYADKPLVGPTLYCAGPMLRVTGGHGATGAVEEVHVRSHLEADGPDGFRAAARYCIKMGVDWIKIALTGGIAGVRESMDELQMTEEEIRAVCDVAHRKRVKVCAHTGSAQAARIGIQAGVDCIEHGYQLDEEVCALMAARGTYYCPTLSVTHDEAYMRRWQWPEYSIRRALEGAAEHRRAFQRALAAGVRIVNGADLNPIADTAIPEVEWTVRAGATPAQALVASTRRAAELCGVADRVGTVSPGKAADLVVVGRNPLEDIAALRDVRLVVKAGRIVFRRDGEEAAR